jgi:hypothetical protein
MLSHQEVVGRRVAHPRVSIDVVLHSPPDHVVQFTVELRSRFFFSLWDFSCFFRLGREGRVIAVASLRTRDNCPL